MEKTYDQINEIAKECVLSQYGSEDHEEYLTALNACIIGINMGIRLAKESSNG